ncbi:MAG: ABC transporter substrate-binding protein [Tepidibacter sp.]|uniref:ABC transporter substrate-binding protein n=1 Tax=Tepidibacter sp. TaxID=2529387 RepID=UPI0025E9058A|nr:ABC transporter substrate-binding protein [Tepidibacter sp.]MCT4507385.1 ABC transporter substrate-binding protein [Tepidibacter sp.]
MKKLSKLLVCTLVITMLCAMLSACSSNEVSEEPKNEKETTEDSRYGGTIVVAQKMTPPHLDSDKSTDWAISSIMNHVYEGLFEFDKNFEAQPHLAKGYEITDGGKTYNVKLREKVLFHNGKEMTSEDVIASFNRWVKNNDAGNMIAPYFDKAEIVGPYEINFKFKENYAPFINILASHVSNQKMVVRPKEVIEKFGDDIITEHIGTGPYKFVKWTPDQQVELAKFEEYAPSELPSSMLAGERKAYADNIVIQFVKEQAVRVAGVQTGEFQFAEEAPQDQYDMFESNPDINTVIVKPDGMEMLIINEGIAPFDNINARKALVHAIDMKEQGRGMIGDERFWDLEGCLYPKGNIWYDEDSGKGIYNDYDLEKSKELLKKAGYDGTPIVIVSGQDDKVEKQGAITLKNQLEKAGFKVELQLFDRPTVVEKRSKKEGWNLHLSYFYKSVPDPQVHEAWTGTNAWISNWDDEDSHEMDEVFARMKKETDFEKRHEIVKEFYNKAWDTVPYINMLDYSRLHITNKELKGYTNGCQPFFWNTWLEK